MVKGGALGWRRIRPGITWRKSGPRARHHGLLTVVVAVGEQAKQIIANLVPHEAGKRPAA
ncbi:MAG: hypothetical protein ACRDTT_27065 [Pseudonocardiaceae bacterium]